MPRWLPASRRRRVRLRRRSRPTTGPVSSTSELGRAARTRGPGADFYPGWRTGLANCAYWLVYARRPPDQGRQPRPAEDTPCRPCKGRRLVSRCSLFWARAVAACRARAIPIIRSPARPPRLSLRPRSRHRRPATTTTRCQRSTRGRVRRNPSPRCRRLSLLSCHQRSRLRRRHRHLRRPLSTRRLQRSRRRLRRLRPR